MPIIDLFKDLLLTFWLLTLIFIFICIVSKNTKTTFIYMKNDLWIGVYHDIDKHIIYIFLIPCIGFKIQFFV